LAKYHAATTDAGTPMASVIKNAPVPQLNSGNANRRLNTVRIGRWIR
jgi:hypothetical protein